jgi:hypothetical protein
MKVLQKRSLFYLYLAALWALACYSFAEAASAIDSASYLRSANDYRRKGFIALAIVHANKALQLDPSLTEAMALRDDCLKARWNVREPEKDQTADESAIRQVLKIEVLAANNHDIDGCFKLYADDYLNSDGFDKTESRAILENFLEMYPDARTELSVDNVLIYGPIAASSVLEKTAGISGKEMPGLGKGTLSSTYRRVRYLRKENNSWKFIGASAGVEDVTVAFGDGQNCSPRLESQTKGDSVVSISAVLTCKLGADQSALGSISSQAETFPAQQPKDGWRPMYDCKLERIMTPNKEYRNELITATIGVSNRKMRSLTGLVLLTRKVNLLPESSVVAARP